MKVHINIGLFEGVGAHNQRHMQDTQTAERRQG